MKLRLVATTAILSLLVACGSETSPEGGGGGGALSDDQLAGLLLTVEDLPPGFVADDSDSGGEDADPDELDVTSGNEACGDFVAQDDVIDLEAQGEAAAEFTGGELGPFVSHEIKSYASADELERGFSALSDLIAACAGERLTMRDEDYSMDLVLGEGTFAALGDRTASISIEGSMVEFGLAIRGEFVVVQSANQVSLFSVLSFNEAGLPAAQFEDLARTAVERLENAL